MRIRQLPLSCSALVSLAIPLFILVGTTATSQTFASTATLPDSGQSNCFNELGEAISCTDSSTRYRGQDAHHAGREMTFRDNGDGTVTDLNTGLMWQKTPDFRRQQHDEATEYANALELAGYTDWRLPTIKELYSLAHFDGELVRKGESTPYIDTRYFDFKYDRLKFAGQYWSSTIYVKGGIQHYDVHGSLEGAFGFNFADGHIKAYESGHYFDGTRISKDDGIMVPGAYVRAVRGSTTLYGMDYVDNGDKTVTDRSTKLMWAQHDSGRTMDWLDALAYAEAAELAGHTDWRLPNTKELQSLVDYDKRSFPAINTDFFDVSVGQFEDVGDTYWVWTGTTQGDFKHTACYISFGQAWSKKNSDAVEYFDWHGAGAQRSDPKSGNPDDYELASAMAADLITVKNHVRLVRDLN